ncbi:MAG TPA: Rv3235 family protein [Jiangellaceae bacterium]|nr:Rv3235 family protein [Jiangellaceae bacterium]
MTTRATIRRLPCPVSDPPFDDEIGIPPGTRPVPPTQGALALAFMLPSGVPAEPEPPATLRLVDDPTGWTGAPDELDPFVAEFTARRPTSGEALPEPRRWSARLAQAIVETLSGHRPVQQLLKWTDDAVYSSITSRLASRPRTTPGARPTLRSIRVCTPTDGVAEASAVIQTGNRCRAIAMRLEGLDGQWRCTALEIV